MPALAACWKVRLLSSREGSAFTSAMVMMAPLSLQATATPIALGPIPAREANRNVGVGSLLAKSNEALKSAVLLASVQKNLLGTLIYASCTAQRLALPSPQSGNSLPVDPCTYMDT